MDRLNSWLTLIANVGVLGGFLFLAYEIQQNTAQLRAEASYSINEALSSLNSAEYSDLGFAGVLNRGELDLASLDPAETRQFFAYQFDRINLALHISELEKDGLHDVHFPYREFLIQDLHRKPGLQQFLEAVEETYIGDRALYNELLRD
jgi:hypothetical protein